MQILYRKKAGLKSWKKENDHEKIMELKTGGNPVYIPFRFNSNLQVIYLISLKLVDT